MQVKTAILGILLAALVAGCDSKSDLCIPACEGRQCGIDSLCGQSCGACPSDEVCDEETGSCTCVPSCAGRWCGDDGCGRSCGTCGAGELCQANGQCVCAPDCTNKECGEDGCLGSCGDCGVGEQCTAQGLCETLEVPCCEGRICGPDPCFGTSCGTCLEGGQCDASGQCVCVPNCAGRECGTDDCGGSCGECETCHGEPAPDMCNGHVCMRECCGDCGDLECGVDPVCGTDVCGTCPEGTVCDYVGRCVSTELQPGEPCAFGEVNLGAGECLAGLTCLGMAPNPEVSSCSDAVDCCVLGPWNFNLDCVGGSCGYSFCSVPCTDGGCEGLFTPADVSGTCYCIPMFFITGAQSSGEPCTFEDINNPGCPMECDSGLACLGESEDPVNMPCASDADCSAFLPGSRNPDCVNGGCGASYCAAQCIDDACATGFEPITESGNCYCRPVP